MALPCAVVVVVVAAAAAVAEPVLDAAVPLAYAVV